MIRIVVASAIGAERIFDEVLHTGRERAGREDRQVLVVAAIQGHLRDGSVLDHLAEVGSFGFEQRHLASLAYLVTSTTSDTWPRVISAGWSESLRRSLPGRRSR